MPRRKKDQYGIEYQKVRDSRGKIHHVPVGADIHEAIKRGNEKWQYTAELGAKIVLEYTEGKNIQQIAKSVGYPAGSIYSWMRTRTDFRDLMKGARESRAFHFEEKAIQAAEDAKGDSSEEVAAQRLKSETYKWAAEVNNRETFGRQVKSVGEVGPTTIIINTGISREGDEPAAIPTTGKRLESEG